jgi:hypothetical protein
MTYSNKIVRKSSVRDCLIHFGIDASEDSVTEWAELVIPHNSKNIIEWPKSHIESARSLLKKLTPEDRLELFHEYCIMCGSDNPKCNCSKDE